MNRHKILVVNDAPDQLELFALMLQDAGYKVSTARNGVEGFKTARRVKPDLILSDVMMPEMNGIDFCRKIRADEKLFAVPFLLVSSLRKDAEAFVEGFEAEADDYIEAPVEPMRLIAKVAQLIERKQMNDALRESENRFRIMIENVADIITILDSNGKVIYESPAITSILGYEADELNGRNVFELVHPEDAERTIEYFLFSKKTLTPVASIEYRFRHKDDSWRTLKSIGRPYIDAEKGLLGIVTSRDVTERRKAEAALRRSEERYRNFIERSAEGIWRIEFDEPIPVGASAERFIELASEYAYFAECNLAMARMYGYDSVKGVVGKYLKDVLVPNDETNLKLVRDFAENGYKLNDGESHEFGADGQEKYFFNNLTGIIENGNLTAIWGTQRDVTERKKAEESIRFQAHLLDTVEQAVIATDLNGRVTYWNQYAQRLYGWTSEEAVGKNILNLTTPETSHEQAKEILTQLAAGKSWSGEFSVRNKNGETFPAEVINSPINDAEGNLIGIVGISVDITERKRAEEALSRSETHLRAIINTDPECVALLDLNGRLMEMNPAGVKMVEADSLEQVLSKSIVSLISPEYREDFRALIGKVLKGAPRKLEFELTGLKGTRRWLETNAVPLRNASGEIISLLAVTRDISVRKEAEKAFTAANEQAIREYDILLQRLAALAQATGAARDLDTIFSAILDFVHASLPCSALFVSLYDKAKSARKGIYLWYNGREIDVSDLEPIRVGDGLIGNVVRAGEVIIDNDYKNSTAERKPTDVYLGYEEDGRDPLSSVVAPMKIKGAVIGLIEVQSYDRNAYTKEHATALKMAANITANSIENVRLLEKERKSAETLKQSQKLESVGRLAGGIAHDFNNMLTAINGYSDLSLRRLKEGDPVRNHIEEIKKAGERSAALTHQLLAFSRKQVLKPKILDLNEIIVDTTKMLRRLIGEDIQLNIVTNPQLGLVEADLGQLTQVIMNLAINARDAMPDGGNLTIETANVYLDEEFAEKHAPTNSGFYVQLSVTDTGVGMDAETRERVFEPFFTTKELGKGTGLGLSTVYGIVKQSGGYIWVYSEIGKGTSFKIYLPRINEKVVLSEEQPAARVPVTGTETILLVEDEQMVRDMSRQMLEGCGYKVIEASDGINAIEICRSLNEKIDLMLTDVVMPKMGGRELAEKIIEIQPDIEVLFTSGYTDDAIIRQGMITEEMNFIQKPFTFEALTEKVRELLDAKGKT